MKPDLTRFLAIVAALALAATALDAIFHPHAAAQAWLAAWLFAVSLPVGAMFFVAAHALTGGRWGFALAPALFELVGTLPWMSAPALVVLIALRAIYPWAGHDHGWLSMPFFASRMLIYLALWNLIGVMLWRRRRDDGGIGSGLAWISLLALFATTSLAGFDWIMTLEPRWVSTIFGLLVTAGWALAALAGAMLLGLARGMIAEMERDILGRLLLALALLSTYLATIQLIVVWESNLPHDIPWLARRSGGFLRVAVAMMVLQFLLPFGALVWRPARRSARALGIICVSILAGHLVETWWLTVPDFAPPFGVAEPLLALAFGSALILLVTSRPAAMPSSGSRP